MRQLIIGNKIISEDSSPYVIAEIGNNHQGSLDTCKQLFREAARCGADAVKLQKRDNRTLFTKTAYDAPYDNENSYGKTYGEHREFLEFGLAEYIELNRYAENELGITFFATAFDEKSAGFLDDLDMPAYKIASADIVNIPLIKSVMAYGKPIIISTGGASWEDMDRAYELLNSKIPFSFLHCVATYPNKDEELNLNVIQAMKERYPDIVIGFSSHHPALFTSYAAYMVGARIIEVHFTLNRALKGTDHALSFEPKGLETLCSDLKRVKTALGFHEKVVLTAEKKAVNKLGKSIYPAKFIEKGERITPEKVVLKSPGGGLKPYELENIMKKIAINDLSTDIAIMENDLGYEN